MGDKTGIEWTDATWNPVTGCDRTSPGCDHCYALKMAGRLKLMGQANYQTDGDPRTSGPGFGVQTHEHMLDQPLRWKRPRRVFVNSMSDLFHSSVPVEFIVEVFARMLLAPQHSFQVLTKRPKRMAQLLNDPQFDAQVWQYAEEVAGDDRNLNGTLCDVELAAERDPRDYLLPNVWLGTSIENDRYTFRADHLRETPAAVRWISAEPLLGPLPSLDLTGIDWLVVGGESGPGARPMHPAWPRDLRDQCLDNTCPECGQRVERGDPDVGLCSWCGGAPFGTAFLFKQWGAWAPIAGDGVEFGRWVDAGDGFTRGFRTHGDALMSRFGKKAAGRELDGRTWDEYPVVSHG